MEEITINGEVYVKKADMPMMAEKRNGMEYCIVRTYSAGVFAGYLENREGKECILRDARRIWYFEGVASLYQIAVDGPSNPEKCKLTVEVDKVTLTEVIEIIPCTQKAKKSIEAVPVWKM